MMYSEEIGYKNRAANLTRSPRRHSVVSFASREAFDSLSLPLCKLMQRCLCYRNTVFI